MPLPEDELQNVRDRVMAMFMDTIKTFKMIRENADAIYGERATDIRAAIDEYLNDFLHNTEASGETTPKALIDETPRQNFQRAGLYGAQLNIKERQITNANDSLRDRLAEGVGNLWRNAFKKWIDIVNNFLGSLAGATGLSEALKELKDCLRDELPDDEAE